MVVSHGLAKMCRCDGVSRPTAALTRRASAPVTPTATGLTQSSKHINASSFQVLSRDSQHHASRAMVPCIWYLAEFTARHFRMSIRVRFVIASSAAAVPMYCIEASGKWMNRERGRSREARRRKKRCNEVPSPSGARGVVAGRRRHQIRGKRTPEMRNEEELEGAHGGTD